MRSVSVGAHLDLHGIARCRSGPARDDRAGTRRCPRSAGGTTRRRRARCHPSASMHMRELTMVVANRQSAGMQNSIRHPSLRRRHDDRRDQLPWHRRPGSCRHRPRPTPPAVAARLLIRTSTVMPHHRDTVAKRLRQRERSGVQRLADDGTLDTDRDEVGDRLEVGQRRDSPAGDDRVGRSRQRPRAAAAGWARAGCRPW